MSDPASNDPAGTNNDNNSIRIKQNVFSRFLALSVIGFVVAAFLGGYLIGTGKLFPTPDNNTVQPQTIQSQITTPPTTQTLATQQLQVQRLSAVSADDDPTLGNADASITIIEFSDFQCPFCQRFATQTFPLLYSDYIETGKVKFVYRDFPIDSHLNAKSASMAANCANEQGQFWEYHDQLFASQAEWRSIPTTNVNTMFKQYASNLGLDVNQFESCVDEGRYADEISNDLRHGVAYKVSGTPSFYIGNDEDGYVQIVGAKPYDNFKQSIDSMLD